MFKIESKLAKVPDTLSIQANILAWIDRVYVFVNLEKKKKSFKKKRGIVLKIFRNEMRV